MEFISFDPTYTLLTLAHGGLVMGARCEYARGRTCCRNSAALIRIQDELIRCGTGQWLTLATTRAKLRDYGLKSAQLVTTAYKQ